MSRRLIVSIAAVVTVLVGAGVLAGVLIANGDDSAPANNGPAYFGASLQDLPFNVGNVVTTVDKDSPAAKAGLTFGDSIQSLDGQSIKTREDVERVVAGKKPGDEVALGYWRLGKSKTLNLKLTNEPKLPAETQAGDLEFGTVKAASDKAIKVGLALSDKDVTYDVGKATRFWRNFDVIKASDLKQGDLVMVVSVDGGKSALSGLVYSQ